MPYCILHWNNAYGNMCIEEPTKSNNILGVILTMQWQTHLTQQVIINETPKCERNIIQIETNLKTTEEQENLPQIKHWRSTVQHTPVHAFTDVITEEIQKIITNICPEIWKKCSAKEKFKGTWNTKRRKGYDEKQNKII